MDWSMEGFNSHKCGKTCGYIVNTKEICPVYNTLRIVLARNRKAGFDDVLTEQRPRLNSGPTVRAPGGYILLGEGFNVKLLIQ